MSRRVQPLRRKNIRKTIVLLKQGERMNLPCYPRWLANWSAGMRKAAKVGKKIAADLDRNRKPASVSRARQYRIAPPGRRPNPPLPAQQKRFKRTFAFANELRNLREARAARRA